MTAITSLRVAAPTRLQRVRERTGLDTIELAFLLSALLAPADIELVGSLTVSDVMTVGVAYLLVADGRRIAALPPLFFPAIMVFLGAAAASGFRATHPTEAFTQLLQLGFIMLVQLSVVLTVVNTRRMLHLAITMVAIGSLAGNAASLVMQQAQGADRILAFYSDNPNRLSYPTAYLLPFVLHFVTLLWERGQRWRACWIGGGLLYLMIWALAASASRGGALATLVGLVPYIVFSNGRSGSGRRLLLTALGIGAVVVVLFNTTVFPVTLRDRVDRSLTADAEEQTTLLADRERLADAAVAEIIDSPFVGTGLDNFRFVAQKYHPQATAQAPHNMWLGLMAETGVIGAAACAFLFITWFELVLRARALARDRETRRLAWASATSMMAVMSIFMTIPIMIHRHYWLLFGLGLSLVELIRTAPVDPDTVAGPTIGATAR
ncbi:MAG: O-antigen ligase family protein [Acidimicrobiia bacterium]